MTSRIKKVIARESPIFDELINDKIIPPIERTIIIRLHHINHFLAFSFIFQMINN